MGVQHIVVYFLKVGYQSRTVDSLKLLLDYILLLSTQFSNSDVIFFRSENAIIGCIEPIIFLCL